MKNRVCKKCSEVKSLSNFPSAGIVNGVQYWRHLCNTCYVKSKKPRQLRIREEYYSWKKTLQCERCGYSDYRALQFHHHEGNKENNVADLLAKGVSLNKIKEEAGKCTILCANCHSIEHHHGM